MEILKKLFQTNSNDYAGLILRLALGIVMFPHGAQKLFGWYGGYGFSSTIGFFTEQMHFPWIIAFLVIMAESIGAVLLILGLLTRFSAFGIGLTMFGAMLMVHWKYGFFMNWFGKQEGEGIEYFILLLSIAIALIIKGAGSLSLDDLISKKIK